MRATETWSAAWVLAAQREAARNGNDTLALNVDCVLGCVMFPSKPRAASSTAVPMKPSTAGRNTDRASSRIASARRMAWAASPTVGLRSMARLTASSKETFSMVCADARAAPPSTSAAASPLESLLYMGALDDHGSLVLGAAAHLARRQRADHHVEHRDEEDGQEGRGQ